MSSVLPDVVMSYLDCDSGSARRVAIIAFLAQGWHLALLDVPFFAGKIYACPDGQIQIAAPEGKRLSSADAGGTKCRIAGYAVRPLSQIITAVSYTHLTLPTIPLV